MGDHEQTHNNIRSKKPAVSGGGLGTKDETKILKHWGYLKKTLHLAHIVDPLIEKGVLTIDRWMALKSKSISEAERVEEFLYALLKGKPETYSIFLVALKSRGYTQVANQLEGIGSEEISPPLSGGSIQNRHVGRPLTVGKVYNQDTVMRLQELRVVIGSCENTRNFSLADPRNGASDILSETGASSAESAVKQDDLNKMKEEITTELRQLRMNIEMDRDQDRLELQVLQRKHTELQNNFTTMHGEKDCLVKELTDVTATVNDLKKQMKEREKEFNDLRQKNKELRQQLETKANDLQKLIHQKEKERDELVKALKVNDLEYKKLQAMLETLKTDHEDRLNRLKNVNKEKFKLEKDVQLLVKEKRNLETKISSMDENIRSLQETHAREAGNITQELEKQKTLLDEKEKERADLEKRLEESVRENENLKMRNIKLEECLQKSQDEKAHLQSRVRAHDMSSYAIPPFLVGNKANRPGWRPTNYRNPKK